MPVRVAICDDSRTYAEALRRFLEADGTLDVVDVAASAEDLIAGLARTRPALVTMDLELPGIDGVDAIRRIMGSRPLPIVVVSSHVGRGGVRLTDAIAAGAVDAVAKRELRLDRRAGPQAVALRQRLARLAGPAPSAPPPLPPPPPLPLPAPRRGAPREAPATARALPRASVATAIGVATSTGGPGALAKVLGALPADFPLPVLVVQHMTDGFTAGLADWLDASVPPPVRLARDGEPAGAGVVIAPDGAHLLLDADGRLRLDRRTDTGVHRPSADVLLVSLARSARRGAVAVVLTGMGRDGAAGVAAVRDAGGVALAERPDRAALSGMPAAATEAGATPLELAEIGRALADLSRSRHP